LSPIPKQPLPQPILDRESRYKTILAAYPDGFSGSVLDLGCDVRHLERLARPARYVGVGLEPGSTLVHNLESTPYPFDDASFETVVCLDVLEHLEEMHAATAEIFRIASKRVVLTLPNAIDHILAAYLFRRRYRKEQWTKFYSLTAEPPADRHRWFFSEEEADRFLLAQAAKRGFSPGRCHHHRLGLKSHLMALAFGLLAGNDGFGKWTLVYEFVRD
jgi:SAM-dependent methyltransferase